MTNIPERWTFEEEVYYFRSDPRAVGATVLMTVDEASYNGESSFFLRDASAISLSSLTSFV